MKQMFLLGKLNTGSVLRGFFATYYTTLSILLIAESIFNYPSPFINFIILCALTVFFLNIFKRYTNFFRDSCQEDVVAITIMSFFYTSLLCFISHAFMT